MPEGRGEWSSLLPGTVLHRVAVYCSELQCVAVYGIIRACPKDEVNDLVVCQVLCCSVLQRVAACCCVLQSVAVCCSVLQFTGLFDHSQRTRWMTCFFARYCVAVFCSVLQCVAMEGIIQACSKSELDGFILWQILCYCVAYTQACCIHTSLLCENNNTHSMFSGWKGGELHIRRKFNTEEVLTK